jgi:hypothetical protein
VKRVIVGLPAWVPVGFAFIIATGESDGLSASGSTPGLEDSCCNSTILTGKVVLSVSGIKKRQSDSVHPGAPEGDEVPPEVPEVLNNDAEEGNSLKLFQVVRLFQIDQGINRTKWAKPAVAYQYCLP